MRIMNAAIWVTLGFILGMGYQAGVSQEKVRREVLRQSLKSARSGAATCFWMVGDHWMKHHLNYPMSRRLSATALDLSLDYQRLMEAEDVGSTTRSAGR